MRPGLPLILLPALFAAVASAQDAEFDRQVDPGRDRPPGSSPPHGAKPDPQPSQPPGPPPPPDASGRVPRDQGKPTGRFIDEPFDPSALPSPPPPPEEPSLLDRITLRPELKLRLGAGYDSNVFRAERGRTADGYGRARGEAELLAAFPGGTELFGEVAGEATQYLERHRANEYVGSTFLEVFQPVTGWLDVGAQNTFEASRQNLLDDNGDLFPRGRFGSLDEELRLYAIFRPHEDVALEVGAAHRWKDYEENSGVESLDYREVRLDASASWRLLKSPRTRLKLKYRFRRRDYRELSARDRDGLVPIGGAPTLDLHRHQVNLTLFQDLKLSGQELRLVVGPGFTYNRDLFQDDRSYREVSGSLRVEWWPLPQRTRLDLSTRGVARDFVVRRPPGRSGLLRHRLVDVTLGCWQRLGELPVAVYAEGTAALWRSGDPLEGYERFIFEAGLEVVF